MSARGPRKLQLTALQRHQVEQARTVAASEAEALAGFSSTGPANLAVVYATALGHTKATITTLLQIIDELTGGTS